MARPTQKERTPLAQAIRRFRIALEDSQQQFAKRLGVALTSVARYETNFQPSADVMVKLAQVAREKKMPMFVEIFEGRLKPEPAEFRAQELSATIGMLAEKLDDISADRLHGLRRARILLGIAIARADRLAELERVIQKFIPAELDDLIDWGAGEIIRERDPEVEARHIAYLLNRDAKSFMAYFEAAEKFRGSKLRKAPEFPLIDLPLIDVSHVRRSELKEVSKMLQARQKESKDS